MSLYGAGGTRKYLTLSERRRFLRAVGKLPPEERLFCLMLAWSGGRISEVLALTADSFDLDSGCAAFETLKRRKRGLLRQVPLPPFLLTELKRVMRLRRLQENPRSARQRLWRWSRATAWRRIKQVMELAGIAGTAAMPKGLRHTFGVTAFGANVPPHLVQRWLGHASLRTTAIYGDVMGLEERRIARRMWRKP
jgi:integrase